MTFEEIVSTSISRARHWHPGGIEEWSALEWAGAMCGEAGECANAAKKLRRLELGIASINHDEDHMSAAVSELHGRHYTEIRQAQQAVAYEACDTILYAVLVMARAGFTGREAESLLAKVFNRKSDEYGFPERI